MRTGELQATLHAAVIAQFVMHTVLLLRIGTCDQRVMRITVLGGFLPCCLDGERSLLAGFRARHQLGAITNTCGAGFHPAG
jgi:hypothetical protein